MEIQQQQAGQNNKEAVCEKLERAIQLNLAQMPA